MSHDSNSLLDWLSNKRDVSVDRHNSAQTEFSEVWQQTNIFLNTTVFRIIQQKWVHSFYNAKIRARSARDLQVSEVCCNK